MKKIILSVLFWTILWWTWVFWVSYYFSDVEKWTWYFEAVTNLAEKGIIKWYSDVEFGPTNNVNRAELAVVIDRLIKYIDEQNYAYQYQINNATSSSNYCLDYTYSTCPDTCYAVCTPSSCSEPNENWDVMCTDDCDWKNSCIWKD